jgi:RNA polymerase sigma-54 factor
MHVGLKQQLKLQQNLVMTPQLKMAIKLLTLNHLELKDAVAQELVDNPVLEESFEDAPARAEDREVSPEEVAREREQKTTDAKEVSLDTQKQPETTPDIDWEAYAESYSYLPPGAGGARDVTQNDLPGYDQTLTRAETLEQHLMWQVQMSDFNPLEVTIAIRLLGEMNDDGFLDNLPAHRPDIIDDKAAADGVSGAKGNPAEPTFLAEDDEVEKGIGPGPLRDHETDDEAGLLPETADEPSLLQDGVDDKVDASARIDPVEMVAQDLEIPVEWVETVRHRMLRFDPVGCLARDLRECLLVQLDVWGYDDDCMVYNIVDKYIHDVERRNYQVIAKAFKVPLAEVGEALHILEALEPRPARNFLPGGQTADQQYITPDVYVHKIGDEHVVALNEDGLPKLKVSQFYLEQLKQAARGDPSKSYIKDKMRSATWLIRSIHQRQRTINKVVDSILKFQQDWFDGKGPLRPLILKEVADDIEMHESTVSRVTSRKYLHCQRGVYELKYFFNSSIAGGDGTSIASESVKGEIRKIVAGENPKKPLSDAAIVKALKDRNIDIARRTVAKYREMLNIMPSNRRKQVF